MVELSNQRMIVIPIPPKVMLLCMYLPVEAVTTIAIAADRRIDMGATDHLFMINVTLLIFLKYQIIHNIAGVAVDTDPHHCTHSSLHHNMQV